MLSDIEMPQEDGLKLLEWVKRNYPETETIILTCHTDFLYARKALQLGSSDYALKSMPYDELEKVVQKSIEKIASKKDLQKVNQLGKLWQQNQPFLVEQFWIDIVNGNIIPSKEDFERVTSQDEDKLSADMNIVPIIIQITVPKDMEIPNDKKLLISKVKKHVEDAFAADGNNGYFVALNSLKALCILQTDDKPEWKSIDIIKIIDKFKKFDIVGLSCYIGEKTIPSELADMVSKLNEMQKDNVANKSGIFYLTDKKEHNLETENYYKDLWASELLEGMSYEKSISNMDAYLNSLVESGRINAFILKQFHQDFMQLIYSLLKQKNIQAHLLFNDVFSISLFEKATNSVPDMMEWVRHIIYRIQDYTSKREDSMTIIDKVKMYINLHLKEELCREDIANYVFLNPDYLTRLLKKETGLTLSEYT